MTTHVPTLSPDDADDGSVDFAVLRYRIGFALRAARRHPRLAAGVLAAALAASVLAVVTVPRTYEVTTVIAAQRNLVMPSLGNPRRAVPSDSDAPTRGAPESVLAHDNLVAVVEEAKLLERWDQSRTPVLRAKDAIFRIVSGAPSLEDRQRAVLGVLKKQLWVAADESTIRISLTWNDPRAAYDVVSLVERNFLDGRSAVETAVIGDTISILEGEAEKAREAADDALATTQAIAARVATPPPAASSAKPSATVLPAPAYLPPPGIYDETPEDRAERIAGEIERTQAAIRAVEAPWQRNLSDLQAKLADLRHTYGPAHPEIVALESRIAAAAVPPPELATLKSNERALLAKQDALPPPAKRLGSFPLRAPRTDDTPRVAPPILRDEPPELTEARAKLQTSSFKYEELLGRIDAARIELATARAAFKYRYRVVEPPEVPKKPLRSGVAYLFGGAILAIALAVAAAVLHDLASGRYVEAEQMRRRLRIPVLGEVREP